MPSEEQLIKRDIVKAAIGIYLKNKADFNEKNIATRMKLNEKQFTSFFKNKNEVLQYFYVDAMLQYREMVPEIEGFENATLEEKISNFIYMMFDIFQPYRKFVEKTFDALILMRVTASPFQKEVENIFKEISDSDYSVSALVKPVVSNPLTFDIFSRQYFLLIKFWLSDHSENHENTIALVDKSVSLFTEVIQTRIPDKALELFKYVVVDKIGKIKIPFIGNFLNDKQL